MKDAAVDFFIVIMQKSKLGYTSLKHEFKEKQKDIGKKEEREEDPHTTNATINRVASIFYCCLIQPLFFFFLICCRSKSIKATKL